MQDSENFTLADAVYFIVRNLIWMFPFDTAVDSSLGLFGMSTRGHCPQLFDFLLQHCLITCYAKSLENDEYFIL